VDYARNVRKLCEAVSEIMLSKIRKYAIWQDDQTCNVMKTCRKACCVIHTIHYTKQWCLLLVSWPAMLVRAV